MLNVCRGFSLSTEPNSTTPGTATPTTSKGQASPTLRLVHSPKVRGDDLLTEVKCEGTLGQVCTGKVMMHVTEHETRRGSVTLTAAKGAHKKSVIVGDERLSVA